MKTFAIGLLKGRMMRWSMVAVMLAAAGLSVAWMETGQYKLGGAFIGSGGGMIWNAYQMPLDSAGKTANLRVQALNYGADFAGLLALFGADSITELTSQQEMISHDTSKYSSVGYGLKQGNPPAVAMILVMPGTAQFTGAEGLLVTYTLEIYPGPANALGLPNADADGDGFPDAGATPFVSIPGSGTAKRVLP